MRIQSQRNFWSGVLFVVVGAAFALGSWQYPMGNHARPGPGYFPLGLGILQVLLGLGVIWQSLSVRTADGEPLGPVAWRPLLVVVGSIVFFGWALPRWGLLITVPLLVIGVSFAGGPVRWVGALIAAAVLTLGAWAIFVLGLNLTLPLWPTRLF